MAGTISEHAATAANREKLVSFFAAGASNSRKVGVEMEHVVVRSGSGAPVGYSGPDGIGALLEDLSASYTTVTPVHEDGTGGILGLRRSGHVITLEPASQFEISMRPFERVADVGAEYERFRATLDPALERIGAETPLVGYHPTTHVDDLELIPKYRYACMDRHFCEIGTLGRGMMRGSASLQVSVDYRNEVDAVAKLRAASAIGPLTYLMLDNAPVFNGQWRTRHCVREMCWTGCDPDRCMVVPGLFDEGFGFADYANWMLATPAILVPDATQPEGWRFTDNEAFNDIYAERVMTDEELLHALTMFFPDARLKNYVEIRQADCVPLPYALAYVALMKGLMYDDDNLGEIYAWCADFDDATVPAMKAAIARDAYDAVLFAGTEREQTAAEVAEWLLGLAARVLDDEERALMEPLCKLVAARKTLAMDWENPYELGPHGDHL